MNRRICILDFRHGVVVVVPGPDKAEDCDATVMEWADKNDVGMDDFQWMEFKGEVQYQ